jgi:DNA-binding response OmpR family regulator
MARLWVRDTGVGVAPRAGTGTRRQASGGGEGVSRNLIVEDEVRLASFLERGLRANGYAPKVVDDGESALRLADDRDFDLMILDLGLPDLDGMDVLRRVRSRGEKLPVIILSARDDPQDMVGGLDAGSDDYVTKPFSLDELLARIRVRLRADSPGEPTVLEAGAVALDLRTRRATVNGRTYELTAREFTMLETFMRHRGQVLSKEQLLSQVWGYDYDPGSNVVEVYVGYLRKKLGDGVIQTVRGMGYRLPA